jgi:hypothetical protein
MQTRFKPSLLRPVVVVVAAVLAVMLMLVLASAAPARPAHSLLYPTTAKPFGKSYTEWSEEWWKWALSLPVEGHPFNTDNFDCNGANNGQTGRVWFLGLSPSPPQLERSCTIPAHTAILIGLANVECSSLEPEFPDGTGGQTAAAQRDCAKFFADEIVVSSLFCTIDGQAVQNLGSFRFPSSQFTFTAPTPWIFGSIGGTGTAVSDGYFLMFNPLSSGTHTLSCGGAFDFGLEVGNTYHLTVE